MDQHYHPIIFQRLQTFFDAGDWAAMQTYLEGLSNSHFRTAGYLIGERLLPASAPEVFWTAMIHLLLWHPKAFTVTTGKAALEGLRRGVLQLSDPGFLRLAEVLAAPDRAIDRQKLLLLWLPAVEKPTDMEGLFDRLAVSDPRRRIDFLLHTGGLTAAFVLLRTLCYEEHDRQLLVSVCRQVMKRGDNLSFNLASLLRTYFDLHEVRGTFSLTLQPFELSRLDTDFDVFKRVITKV